MMAEKTTVQLKQSTRDYLRAESRDGESVDETIQRLLGMEPTETMPFEQLTAYLSDEKTEEVRKAKEAIQDEVDVELDYQMDGGTGGNPVLFFRAETNGVPIAEIETTEQNTYSVRYRSQADDGMAHIDGFGSGITAFNNWEETLRQRVRGAFTTYG